MTELRTVTRRALSWLLALSIIFAGISGFTATGTIAPFPKHVFLDNNGLPCNGCKVFTYTAGTTTKVSTYTDVALTTPNANPIVLDSAGRATIFLTPGVTYKFVLAPSTDTDPPVSPLWTQDNVSAVPPASTASDNDVTGTAGENITAGQAVFLSDGSGGNTVGRWYRTSATNTYSSSAANLVGFAPSSITVGGSGSVRISGRITGLTGLVAGTLYYLDTTAGALTSSAPTNARAIAQADSTTTAIVGAWVGTISASATASGIVSTGAQTWAGVKTFNALPAGLSGILFARSTSDFTKNANITLTDVTGLSFAVGANDIWHFRFVLRGESSTAAGWRFTLTGPAAPTAVWFGIGSTQDAPSAGAGTTFTGIVAAGGAAGTSQLYEVVGLLRNGANAGTVQLQAAQNASDATNSIIRAESYVIAQRLQ
jgi:hypothetical protein